MVCEYVKLVLFVSVPGVFDVVFAVVGLLFVLVLFVCLLFVLLLCIHVHVYVYVIICMHMRGFALLFSQVQLKKTA